MPHDVLDDLHGGAAGLTDREFEVFRALVHTHTGISLNPHKRQLSSTRGSAGASGCWG